MLVGADHDTFRVLHLIGDERITGAGSGRQDVAACFSLHVFVQHTDGNHTGKAFLHHKSRPADYHALSLYALFQLSVFVFQLVKAVCNYREPVSYTHLDVYKRQALDRPQNRDLLPDLEILDFHRFLLARIVS